MKPCIKTLTTHVITSIYRSFRPTTLGLQGLLFKRLRIYLCVDICLSLSLTQYDSEVISTSNGLKASTRFHLDGFNEVKRIWIPRYLSMALDDITVPYGVR